MKRPEWIDGVAKREERDLHTCRITKSEWEAARYILHLEAALEQAQRELAGAKSELGLATIAYEQNPARMLLKPPTPALMRRGGRRWKKRSKRAWP